MHFENFNFQSHNSFHYVSNDDAIKDTWSFIGFQSLFSMTKWHLSELNRWPLSHKWINTSMLICPSSMQRSIFTPLVLACLIGWYPKHWPLSVFTFILCIHTLTQFVLDHSVLFFFLFFLLFLVVWRFGWTTARWGTILTFPVSRHLKRNQDNDFFLCRQFIQWLNTIIWL